MWRRGKPEWWIEEARWKVGMGRGMAQWRDWRVLDASRGWMIRSVGGRERGRKWMKVSFLRGRFERMLERV